MKPSCLVVPLLAVLLLAIGASSASAVIAHLENGTTLSYQPAPGTHAGGAVSPFDTFFTNLDYSGGPVMTSNTNYTFFWRPASAAAYPAEYKSGVNRYFEDLAHDSAGHENVDSVATQYNNAAGEFVKYESKFAGELVDTHAYPPNGCTRAPICLTDAQIRAELERFISEHSLPTDLNHEYFVLPPEGVESCFEEGAKAECSANVTEPSHQAFCAYHGAIPLEGGGEIVYANDPFVNERNCDDPNHINGTSDSALFGGMSHEHVESITDPEPNSAWTDWGASFTGEIGDKCRTFVESSEFGTPLGEVTVAGKKHKYNQVINGDRYWYQQEWSNKGHECLQRLNFNASEAPTAKFAAAVTGSEVKVDATGSTTGANVRYTWQFNDFSGHHENETIETKELTLNHTFPEAGVYTVALTVLKEDGTGKGVAKQVIVGIPQEIKFTSTAPSAATVGGPTYKVTAMGGGSGNPVTFAIDTTSSSVCSRSGATVSFIAQGTCTIDANQAGDTEFVAAAQVQQSFAVTGRPQAITFTSTAPSSATVGGPSYTAAATASSGLPVSLSTGTPSVCSIAGSTASFIGVGTCTIDASQPGNAEYSAATQTQQSFAVGAAPTATSALTSTSSFTQTLTSALTPNSNLTAVGAAFSSTTGAITFTETVANPGTLRWLATFQNGKFGVFAASNARCRKGLIRLGGKCRPAKVVFARGSKTVAAAGTVTFTIKPSASALKALKSALKRKKGLPVTITLTFQSSLGGAPVSHTQSLTVKLKKK